MVFKIALILKEHFRNKIDSYMDNKPDDVVFDFYPYTTIAEIQDIFLSIKDQYDGFYVSGLIPLQAIKLLGDASKDAIISYAAVNVENVYQTLLHHVVISNRKNVDLSRVGMDFLTEDKTLEDLIRKEKFAQAAYTYESYWSNLRSIEEIEEEELRVQNFYVKQCKEQKLDLIITYYYTVLERVKDYGVECCYIYRGEWAFWNSIEELKKSISIKKFNRHRNAVIHINTEWTREGYRDSYEDFRLELAHAVMQFNSQNLNKAIFKSNYDDLELYMDYETMEQLTKGFTVCPLLPFLIKEVNFHGPIGYGIGDNIYQARLNAINASHYRSHPLKNNSGSYLLDQSENLSLLPASDISSSKSTFSVYGDTISEISDRVRLSSETIIRIAEVMNANHTSEITSQDLIDRLGISLRSANKFLSNLEKAGYAFVCGQKRNTAKGRPVNIYRVDLKLNK